MSIELDRTDRDYLYGCLLGAADKLEEYVLKKTNKDRTTAAIRYMQAFSQHPFRTWETIHNCLLPHIQNQKVSGKIAWCEIERINNRFNSVDDFQKDIPLDGSYLIGYYHERTYISDLAKEARLKKEAKLAERENDND